MSGSHMKWERVAQQKRAHKWVRGVELPLSEDALQRQINRCKAIARFSPILTHGPRPPNSISSRQKASVTRRGAAPVTLPTVTAFSD